MTSPRIKTERFHFLDGLRGYAILLTVFAHAFTANVVRVFDYFNLPYLGKFFPSFTASGLDLFFVLSGMVIIRPYIRSYKPFKGVEYVKRRIMRIYPPYAVALVFGSLVVWFINKYPTWYNEKGMRTPFSWVETIKHFLVVNVNGVYYNLAWWSLSVELVFYALVPLIILFFPRGDKLTVFKIWTYIIVAMMVSVIMHFVFTDYFAYIYSMTYNVMNVGKFLDFPVCFLMGIFLAARDFTNKDAWAFIIVGFFFVVSFLFDVAILEPHFWLFTQSGYALIYSGIIIIGFNTLSVSNFWANPYLVWLGERSFSLYLVHFSVFYLVDNLVSHLTPGRTWVYGLLTRSIGIPLALFISMLLFHFVERRFARGLTTEKIFWPWHMYRIRVKNDPKHEDIV